MKHIAICTPSISYGDAVSNDVFGMYNVLENQKFKAGIFAESIHTAEKHVNSIDCIYDFIKKKDDLIIYHLCMGWFKGLNILYNLECKKVIKYHNITPPDFFYNFSSDYVSACGGGIEQLKVIAGLDLDMYLNDSLFNMKEIISMGTNESKCFVVPPFNNIEVSRNLKPDFDVLKKFNDGKVNILSVGRIAPNKGFDKLIEAFYIYHNHYNPESRLIIVGDQQQLLSTYMDYLFYKVKKLILHDHILFTGKINDEQLKSFFLVSKIFALISYHEGFCVPLVEAMSMKIPVAAYNSTAVTETVGNAGVLFDDLNTGLIAAKFNEIILSDENYYYIGEAGWRRYINSFTNEIIKAKFLNLISEFL